MPKTTKCDDRGESVIGPALLIECLLGYSVDYVRVSL